MELDPDKPCSPQGQAKAKFVRYIKAFPQKEVRWQQVTRNFNHLDSARRMEEAETWKTGLTQPHQGASHITHCS